MAKKPPNVSMTQDPACDTTTAVTPCASDGVASSLPKKEKISLGAEICRPILASLSEPDLTYSDIKYSPKISAFKLHLS